MSVKVAIRVRPFNQRQIQLNSKCCVEMDNTKTTLISQENQKRDYSFDYSIWSHDGFTCLDNGLMVPKTQKYWDQTRVYLQVGSQVIKNAWEGYNCCLFAYGQTGSGKSYSMLGYSLNKGIVPLACQAIFTKINQQQNNSKNYEVSMSMIQIYNEKIQDLLIESSKRPKGGLEVRQSKTLGIYVQGVTKHRVNSFRQIQKWMETGAKNRSLASTQMNQYSSRAHTIISIQFVQRQQLNPNQITQKSSTIHLIDLAGSQRVGKTGVGSADRLKQAGSINKSLHHLGLVIQILAEKSQGKRKNQIVPYRSSVLTRILQNSLGGNSKTIMICAISPASDNYEESLSTLKYADQVKKIKNHATVNQSMTDKLIRQLKSENQRLKKLIEEYKQGRGNMDIQNFQQQQRQIQKKLYRTSTAVKQFDLDTSFDQNLLKSIEQQQVSFLESETFKIDEYFITNLNEDQILTGRLRYRIQDENPLIIGRKDGTPTPQVVLGALGIQKNHAQIYKIQQKLMIKTYNESAGDRTFVNGQNVYQPVQLFHNDRIIFGTSCVFLVKTPSQISRSSMSQIQLTYQFAIRQLQQLDKNKSIQEQQQLNSKVKNLEAEKLEMAQRISREKQQFQKRLKSLEILNQKQSDNLLSQLKQKQNQSIQLMIQQQQLEAVKLKSNELQQQLQLEKRLKQNLQQNLNKMLLIQKQIMENKNKEQKNTYEQVLLRQKINKIRLEKQQVQMRQRLIRQQKEIKQEEKKLAQAKYQQFRKQQIKKTEDVLRRKLIAAQNKNILDQRQLEYKKRNKQIGQLRPILIKKQSAQIQKKLIQLLPLITEMNLMTKQMKKNIDMQINIGYEYFTYHQLTEALKNSFYKSKIKLKVQVDNITEGRSYYWNIDKFLNRYDLAKEMLEKYCEDSHNLLINDREKDPFWDPPQSELIGQAFVSMENLLYGLDYKNQQLKIIDHKQILGQINFTIYPTNQSGSQNLSIKQQNSEQIMKPRSWLQKNMYFVIAIQNIELKQPLSHVYIQYDIIQNNYKTVKFKTKKIDPKQKLNYKQKHTIKSISESILYLMSGSEISFKVYGLRQPSTLRNVKSFAQSQQVEQQQVSRERTKTTVSKAEIYQNQQVLSKIQSELEHQKKKSKQKQKCCIF